MDKWYQPRSAARMKPYPWLCERAVEYLNNLIRPDMTVLEHGAGGSTLWLAERVKYVTSVESNLDWYEALRKRIPNNVTVVLGDGVLYLAPVDLLFIDGEPVEKRALWITAAHRLVLPGGVLVLDNANRPEYEREREGLLEYFTLTETINANFSGMRYLVTEFYARRK